MLTQVLNNISTRISDKVAMVWSCTLEKETLAVGKKGEKKKTEQSWILDSSRLSSSPLLLLIFVPPHAGLGVVVVHQPGVADPK